jgi:hypothetical protein
VIHADDSADNAVERFEDGDDNFGVDVSINDGVDTQACDAGSGVTTSGTTGNFATTVLRGGDDNFGVDVAIDMESTHEHAMRLQASQPVAPPAILPPPYCAEVMTTLESTFLLTMESTHEHAMRLLASQPVAPPAILPPPCCAENKLYKNSFPLLTHHCLVCVWQQPWT